MGNIQTHEPKKFVRGSHVFINRGFYSHHVIVVQEGETLDKIKVVHFNGEPGCTLLDAKICSGDLETVIGTSRVVDIIQYQSPRSVDEIVGTALYFAENCNLQGLYNLAICNCEHFAVFCATGSWKSDQAFVSVLLMHHLDNGGDIFNFIQKLQQKYPHLMKALPLGLLLGGSVTKLFPEFEKFTKDVLEKMIAEWINGFAQRALSSSVNNNNKDLIVLMMHFFPSLTELGIALLNWNS